MRAQKLAAQAGNALVSAPADEHASMGTRRSGRIEDRLSFVSGRGGWHPTAGPEPHGESTHANTPVQKPAFLSCADSGLRNARGAASFLLKWGGHCPAQATTFLHAYNPKSRCCADAREALDTDKGALKRGAPHARAAQAARRPSCVVMKACLPQTADKKLLCCDRGTSAH